MKKIPVSCVGDLRKLTLSELAYSIFNSISIDPEYAILSAWHLLHRESLPDRIYNRIANQMGDPVKIKKWMKIPEKYCNQLFECYTKSRVSNDKISLLSKKIVR